MSVNDLISLLFKSISFSIASLVGVFVAVVVYLILALGMSFILPGFAGRFPMREEAGLGMQILSGLAHVVLIVLSIIQGYREGRSVFESLVKKPKIS